MFKVWDNLKNRIFWRDLELKRLEAMVLLQQEQLLIQGKFIGDVSTVVIETTEFIAGLKQWLAIVIKPPTDKGIQ